MTAKHDPELLIPVSSGDIPALAQQVSRIASVMVTKAELAEELAAKGGSASRVERLAQEVAKLATRVAGLSTIIPRVSNLESRPPRVRLEVPKAAEVSSSDFVSVQIKLGMLVGRVSKLEEERAPSSAAGGGADLRRMDDERLRRLAELAALEVETRRRRRLISQLCDRERAMVDPAALEASGLPP